MFNLIKKIKFKFLKKRIINCINNYGKSETLKEISNIIDFLNFHEHDFKNISKNPNNEELKKNINKNIKVISKSKKVLITKSNNNSIITNS